MSSIHLSTYRSLETVKQFLFLYSFEYALNDVFCLDVYEYGLSPKRYGEAVAHGVNLSSLKRSEKEIEVVNTTGLSCFATMESFKEASPFPKIAEWYYPRISSIIASISEVWNRSSLLIEQQVQWVAGVFFGWFAPTLSIKSLPSEKLGPFDDKVVHRDQMGIVGTFNKGTSGNLFGRIQERPKQFLLGLAKLICCIALPLIIVSSSLFSKSLLIAKLALDILNAANSWLPTTLFLFQKME